jgi:3-methyladenine DNA glycosylase/8-oxoguanine DNA glycosylase
MAGRRRIVRTRRPVDLQATLGPLVHGGRRDPCLRVGARDVWRASHTVAGPATVHLRSADATTIHARAWGPGADAALDAVPDLVGAADDPPPLARAHPLVTELDRRATGMRLARGGALLDTLVPTVLEQRVIAVEASRAYRAMVRAAGTRAPYPAPTDDVDDPAGPPALLLPPTAEWLREVPYYRWGVEQRRVNTIKTAVAHARRLAEAESLPVDEARRRLFALPGVGPWTVNTVAALALGDPDAVPVGDYWVKHIVTHALTGAPRGTDERMLELLEPWRGRRGRVCRLLASGGPALPRFGPRLPLQLIASR